MLLKKLIEHFDTYERLPVSINAIRDQIIELGMQDEITFHYVDTNPKILRGLIFRYIYRPVLYAEPKFCSFVCLSKEQEYEWQRLVAAKELLHITDTEAETAQSEKAVEKLLERLSLPFEIREETASSWNDRNHIIPALAILVPKECRVILRSLHEQGKITPIDVARMAKIPERFGSFVISEHFEVILEAVLTLPMEVGK